MAQRLRAPITTRQRPSAWIQAGIAAVIAHGPDGLRIDAICRQLKVTKGSFYHHFQDRADWVSAIARYWADTQPMLVNKRLAELATPEQRLRQMAAFFCDAQLGQRDRAMRSWGASEKSIAKAVRQADEKVLATLLQILQDLKVANPLRRPLALTLMFSAIGFHAAADMVGDREHQQAANLLIDYALRQIK